MSLLTFTAPPFPYYLECGQTVYQPGEQHPDRRNIGIFDLILVQEGTLHIGEEEAIWDVHAGETLLLRPDRFHYAVKPCSRLTSFYWLHFQAVGGWAETWGEKSQPDYESHKQQYSVHPYTIGLPRHTKLSDPAAAYTLFERLMAASTERQSLAVWLEKQLFETMLRLLDLRGADSSSQRMYDVAERTETYIKTHYPDPVTADKLSAALHFHYNYIARCMKQAFGISPMDYLMQYRLEQAKLLLLKTDNPVSEIAASVGFQSAAYFSRCFTSRHGLSPLHYRNRYSP